MDASAKVFTTRWLPVGRQPLEYQSFTTRESITSKRIGQDRLATLEDSANLHAEQADTLVTRRANLNAECDQLIEEINTATHEFWHLAGAVG